MAYCGLCEIELKNDEIESHCNDKHPEIVNNPDFIEVLRMIKLLCRQLFDTGLTEITVKDLPEALPYRTSGLIYESRNDNLWSTPTVN